MIVSCGRECVKIRSGKEIFINSKFNQSKHKKEIKLEGEKSNNTAPIVFSLDIYSSILFSYAFDARRRRALARAHTQHYYKPFISKRDKILGDLSSLSPSLFARLSRIMQSASTILSSSHHTMSKEIYVVLNMIMDLVVIGLFLENR